jgi:predicted esterase YcpF (UPF0227 family)
VLKNRVTISRSSRQSVLREFNNRCAVCGKSKPKIHFIDEDPANADAMNLLPLCPTVHLFDPHNPTGKMEADKLLLLRHFKDPSVLKSQFHTIYRRLQFLDELDKLATMEQIREKIDELVNFLVSFEMGTYYGGRIHQLLKMPALVLPPVEPGRGLTKGATETLAQVDRQHEEQFRKQLQDAQDEVLFLCVEMLRFQKW